MRCLFCAVAVLLLALTGCGARQDEQGRSAGEPRTADANRPTDGTGARETETIDASLTAPLRGYNVGQGRALYVYYCATCHGDEGHGDGLNAYNLDPKPRDLAGREFQQGRTDEDLLAAVRSGGGVAGLSTAMPPWGKSLGDRKIRNIIDYLRTLREPTD